MRVAGEVKGFDATAYMDAKDARRHDRNTHFAVAATGEALRDAGLLGDNGLVNGDVDADRFGMVFGTAIGGIGMMLDGHQTLLERGPRRVSPFMLPHMLPDSASGQVAIQYGIRGPNMAVVSACATGGHAIGEAMEAIVRGQADIMLGAGTEAPLVPLAFAGFGQMRALGTPKDPDTGAYDPAMASRPFDATRDGFVVSEGSAVLVLEELEHALARGARPIAEVIGYGSSADAYDMAAPAERGEGNQRAMRAALARAGIGPEEVDYINAHGTSTPLNDRYETMAIRDVFGEHADRLAGQQHEVDARACHGRLRGDRGLRVRQGHRDRLHPADHQLPPSRSRADARLRPERGAGRRRARRALELDGARRPQQQRSSCSASRSRGARRSVCVSRCAPD